MTSRRGTRTGNHFGHPHHIVAHGHRARVHDSTVTDIVFLHAAGLDTELEGIERAAVQGSGSVAVGEAEREGCQDARREIAFAVPRVRGFAKLLRKGGRA